MIDRPIEVVFAFLGNGENDKLFSKRIIEIARIKNSPSGVGTVYRSKARDFGRTATQDFEITVFERPTRIEWRQLTEAPIMVVAGGYELRDVDGATELKFWGDLGGRGPGKVILGFVSSRVRASFPEFVRSIKSAVEANIA